MANINLKPYMRVRNRQGKVFTIYPNPDSDSWPFIDKERNIYRKTGTHHIYLNRSPFDIVEIVPFTKDDMKEGMKFVCRNGELFFWGDKYCPNCDGDGYIPTGDFSSTLLEVIPLFWGNSPWDIMEVYSLGECIWKRYEEEEEKTPQQLAIEQAEEELKQAKVILEKAEANLKQAKTV